MSYLVSITLINLFVSLLSFVGIMAFHTKIQQKFIATTFVSFAAGIMLSASFLSILPEALEHGPVDFIMMMVLLGMVASFFMERFILWYHHHHEDTHNIKPSAYLVLFGDALHNFIDGVSVAATFIVSPGLGIGTALAIAAHEIPQELADFSILIHAGFNKKRALKFNFLTALTSVLGGIIGYFFLQMIENGLPITLGLTAGMFIYIASADLIPELHEDYKKSRKWYQILPFLIGITLMWGTMQFLPHSHAN